MNKKILVTALCAMMALTGCQGNAKDETNDIAIGQNENVQIPNPLVSYDTLKEASDAVGFTITLPKELEESVSKYIVIYSDLLEINVTTNENSIIIRKKEGNEDISGNFTSFEETETIDIDGMQVTIKGSQGLVNLATWTDGGYSFSIDMNNGVDTDTVRNYIGQIK